MEDLKDNEKCLKLRSILIKVLNELGNVYFINAFENKIRHISDLYGYSYWHSYITDTKYALQVNQIELDELRFIKVKHKMRYLVLNNFGAEAYRKHLDTRNNRARAYWNRKVQKRIELKEIEFQKSRRIVYYEEHKNFLRCFKFSDALKQLSVRDRVNLNRVANDMKLNDNNFPGIFLVRLKDFDYIKTLLCFAIEKWFLRKLGDVTKIM